MFQNYVNWNGKWIITVMSQLLSIGDKEIGCMFSLSTYIPVLMKIMNFSLAIVLMNGYLEGFAPDATGDELSVKDYFTPI
jgi:hypothetical protein